MSEWWPPGQQLICWWEKIDVFWDQWLAQLFRFRWPALSSRVPSTLLLDVLPCVRKWSSVYKTFFIWKNYQTILLFFFTHTYLTKTGRIEWVAVSEDKEVWLEGSRIIRDLDSQAEQFKCETGNGTVIFCLSSSFKGEKECLDRISSFIM